MVNPEQSIYPEAPVYPEKLSDRKRALRAAEIVARNFKKIERLKAHGDYERAEATMNGLVGYLRSREVKTEHLFWAHLALRLHEGGGKA